MHYRHVIGRVTANSSLNIVHVLNLRLNTVQLRVPLPDFDVYCNVNNLFHQGTCGGTRPVCLVLPGRIPCRNSERKM